ncbi:EAL domain-containing protein [uncultured Enterobacter sp.]|uniref:EAL domain-containing protein n=1 Tax=uncultured Enterobacter sp. TaxID=238202 RepID=UPI002609BC87|nr:EAL domain-containing protein [uncultured Enterobacter sp.]
MNAKKIFLLSYDIYLFSGIKSFIPNLVLVDANTFVLDASLLTPRFSSCLLIVDTRVPFLWVNKWLQRNSSQFSNFKCVALTMSESQCINRGYESLESVSGSLTIKSIIHFLQSRALNPMVNGMAQGEEVMTFQLTDFEEELFRVSFDKEALDDFCIANSLTKKALYRYREKITHRLGLSHFNESIIFVCRNNLLGFSAYGKEHAHAPADKNGSESPEAQRLSLALKNDEIVPWFQPIVDGQGEVRGVEILARWPMGHNYAISQREFIPLAEQSGLMSELTSYLMNKVAEDLNLCRGWGDKSLYVAFNVSPAHLSNPVFYWECLHFLELTASLPVTLMIEITENQTLQVNLALKELMRSLRNRGVLFALDDFGTGYANLCYLNELDLDVIKIDKVFINTIKNEEQTLPMLESIINLAKLLGLGIVAEGVEREPQHQWLTDRQVDLLQGYYYLPPVSFCDFAYYARLEHASGLGAEKGWRYGDDSVRLTAP